MGCSTRLMLCAVAVLTGWTEAADWTYTGDHGPQKWGGICESGARQSPVALDPEVSTPGYFEPLAFINYDRETNINITNNGHTVKLNVEQPCSVSIAAGGLHGVFHLDQIHFHWGSEHTLMGDRWPLEVHLVHFDDRYSGVKEAVSQARGLAVVAVLFHMSKEPNVKLDPVIEALSSVKSKAGTSSKLSRHFAPVSLLPQDTTHFFRYDGSLTTPGCDESVIWTVLTRTEPIAREQVAKFQNLMSPHGPLANNYRPLQNLNYRPLYLQSGLLVSSRSHASILTASGPLLALLAVLADCRLHSL